MNNRFARSLLSSILVVGAAVLSSLPTAASAAALLGGGRRTEEQREKLRSCIRWSVGLEHETMLVHRHLNGLEEYAIDANKILREMARYGPIHGLS